MCCRWRDSGPFESLDRVHTHGPNTAGSLQTERQTWTPEKSVCIVPDCVFVLYCEANLVEDDKTCQIKHPTLRFTGVFHNRGYRSEMRPNSCDRNGIQPWIMIPDIILICLKSHLMLFGAGEGGWKTTAPFLYVPQIVLWTFLQSVFLYCFYWPPKVFFFPRGRSVTGCSPADGHSWLPW